MSGESADFEVFKASPSKESKELGAPKVRYPWATMEVGECFEKLLKDSAERQSILGSLKYFKLKNPATSWRYAIEKEGEGSKAKVLKVFRTA